MKQMGRKNRYFKSGIERPSQKRIAQAPKLPDEKHALPKEVRDDIWCRISSKQREIRKKGLK